jgi:hypothetical protein
LKHIESLFYIKIAIEIEIAIEIGIEAAGIIAVYDFDCDCDSDFDDSYRQTIVWVIDIDAVRSMAPCRLFAALSVHPQSTSFKCGPSSLKIQPGF